MFIGTEVKAQSTQVTQPFSLMDSTYFSVKPYYNSPLSFYMQKDSLAAKKGYSPTYYPVSDTVRFLRQRTFIIQVTNSTPVGSFVAVIHKDSTGTINGAKVNLLASNDGINWVTLNDTLSCTNITNNSHTWIVPSPNVLGKTSPGTTTSDYKDAAYEYMPYLYYAIRYLGVATSKADIHCYFVPRHKSTSPN